MKMRKTLAAAVLSVILLSGAFADTEWEGTAAMSRYGEFPVKGLYGASNSFPVNTVVMIENTANKKTAEVIIVEMLSDKNLFMLLSKDASEKLELRQDEVVTVKARVVKQVKPSGLSEKTAGSDPDNNPVKSDPLVISERQRLSELAVESESATEESIENAAGKVAPESVSVPEEMIIIFAEEKDVEDAGAGAVAEEESMTEAGEVPAAAAEGEEAVALAEALPEPAASESDTLAEEFEKKFVLLPASPRPPASGSSMPEALTGESAIEKAKTHEDRAEREKGRYDETFYLQLAAYKDRLMAEEKVGSLNIDYPVVIYYDDLSGMYRIMAGPLGRDERGAALYNARNSGFRDAFIRTGE